MIVLWFKQQALLNLTRFIQGDIHITNSVIFTPYNILCNERCTDRNVQISLLSHFI